MSTKEDFKSIKVRMYGHRLDIHDRFVQKDDFNFNETINQIESLVNFGRKDNIVINIDLHISNYQRGSNYFRINSILEIARKFGIKKIQLNLINPVRGNLIATLDEVSSYISKARYVFLFDLFIKVKGLPYCLIPEPEAVIIKSENRDQFRKVSQCRKCTYNQKCDGILKGYFHGLDLKKIKPKILPKEVMIEVTSQCNFNCQFCFNQASFAKNGRQDKEMSKDFIKKIIDNLKKNNVSFVRFTGGEPLLRKDIFELMDYAKSKDLEVRMNTNAYLIKDYKSVKKLAQYLDYVLISMHAYNTINEKAVTGTRDSFAKKIRAIQWFKEAGVKVVRVNTVASPENISNLEKFYKLFQKMGVDKWQIDRVMPISGQRNNWGKKEASLLIEKALNIKKDIVKKKSSLKVHIINALPLCVCDPIKTSPVCSGAHSVDGHERFVVDPRGFAKPIYYMEENIGNPLDIQKCWNHPFMRFLRDYKNLPKECRKCAFLEKCKGGNRYCAYVSGGDYKAADPLMNYSNVEKYIW
ncbi:MAG: radical SAM protein [bacterium]